jgi:hypothetical protein
MLDYVNSRILSQGTAHMNLFPAIVLSLTSAQSFEDNN